MGIMNLFKKKSKICAVCGTDTGSAGTASRIGYICPVCLRGLVKNGINANSIEKYNADELKKICSGSKQ